MNYISVCSGIEAASTAWQHLPGWKPIGFSEIEPFPSELLKQHYPEVPNLGNLLNYKDWSINEQVDLLVGGTPCQAFSIAGNRRGLDDDRGNLTLSFCAIADHFNPRFVLWENVVGVLSDTRTNPFGCMLAALAGEDEAFVVKRWPRSGLVCGRRRRVAWVTLDAQYFGVPQRRRRVFVLAVDSEFVTSTGERACPSKILSIGTSLRGDSPSRRTQGEGTSTDARFCAEVSPTVTVGPPFSRTGNQRVECDAMVATARMAAFGDYVEDGTASTMKQRDYKDATDLVYGLPGNWIGRAPENGGNAVEPMHNISPNLTATDRHAVAFKVRCGCEGGGKGYLGSDELAFTLSTGHDQDIFYSNKASVRRLTPTECERLQGFPDGYTNIRWKGKDAPDTARYKALGNSMAVPVMRYIGEQINLYNQ